MKQDEKFNMILDQIKELSTEMKEVRQKDIPGVHTRIALAEQNVKDLKEEVKKEVSAASSRQNILGGGIAVLISAAIAIFRSH